MINIIIWCHNTLKMFYKLLSLSYMSSIYIYYIIQYDTYMMLVDIKCMIKTKMTYRMLRRKKGEKVVTLYSREKRVSVPPARNPRVHPHPHTLTRYRPHAREEIGWSTGKTGGGWWCERFFRKTGHGELFFPTAPRGFSHGSADVTGVVKFSKYDFLKTFAQPVGAGQWAHLGPTTRCI